jgi:heat shock protein 1/8
LPFVEQVLKESKLDKSKIDEVILVGGSTRIPRVQELLKDFFNGKQLNKSVNPDEAIAYGATIQSAILHKEQSNVLKDVLLRDVIPLSLGINVKGDIMSVVIEKNAAIPTTRTRGFTTINDNQTEILFKVLEGERVNLADLNILGQFTLKNLPPAPRGALDV